MVTYAKNLAFYIFLFYMFSTFVLFFQVLTDGVQRLVSARVPFSNESSSGLGLCL
jgi:hypothetical protein